MVNAKQPPRGVLINIFLQSSINHYRATKLSLCLEGSICVVTKIKFSLVWKTGCIFLESWIFNSFKKHQYYVLVDNNPQVDNNHMIIFLKVKVILYFWYNPTYFWVLKKFFHKTGLCCQKQLKWHLIILKCSMSFCRERK